MNLCSGLRGRPLTLTLAGSDVERKREMETATQPTTLGKCDKKQYEHCGPHPRYAEVGQRLPPFACVNWKPTPAPQETPAQHSPLPWEAYADVIYSPEGKAAVAAICEPHGSRIVEYTKLSVSSPDLHEAFANRDLIIKCVNRSPAFQKLVEAAKSAADWLCDAHKNSDPWERGQALRKALREVKH